MNEKNEFPSYRLNPAMFVDLYELTMAQAYFLESKNRTASFEVFVRKLPNNWGYFVMAGLAELEMFLSNFAFEESDISYFRNTGIFFEDFLYFLADFHPEVSIRSLPEGAVFFPKEPILEIKGSLIELQILESFILNILGFSIIEASLASRIVEAAKGTPVFDFGLRRAHGPIASIRSARGASLAGFAATSNVFAAKELGIRVTGTMAHSYVQVHGGEEVAFKSFAGLYRENAVLLVDTYNSYEGIKIAASVAAAMVMEENVRIKGIRIDSGDLADLAVVARKYFDERDLGFMKIIASGGLDEFQINSLVSQKIPIDGFAVGTNFSTSLYAPALDINYKIVEYDGRPTSKNSLRKETIPGRKSLRRLVIRGAYKEDRVEPFGSFKDDILVPFLFPEPLSVLGARLSGELKALDMKYKKIESPDSYPVTFSTEFPPL